MAFVTHEGDLVGIGRLAAGDVLLEIGRTLSYASDSSTSPFRPDYIQFLTRLGVVFVGSGYVEKL